MTDRPDEAINVIDLIDESGFSAFQWMIFALCVSIVALDGFDTAAIGFIAPSLTREWHIARPDLAPVLSAALFGLAGGALASGPIADWIGRKKVLLIAVVVMGAASLCAASASDLSALTIWRFVTGLGLGAAMPNAVTLISEYAPSAKRAFITNAMFCGFPLGSALGGFVAAWIIPQHGWRAVLFIGGAAPLALAVGAFSFLPESPRFMARKGFSTDSIRRVLSRISPRADTASGFFLREPLHPSEAFTGEKDGIGLILSSWFRVGTLCLWLAYFMGLVIFYGLVNWMPVMFRDAGMADSTATIVTALFQLGGLGALGSGWLMDRFDSNLTIAVCYLLTALLVFCISVSLGGVVLLAGVVFLAGVAMNTAQASMPTLAAGFYPTGGRATGVSWMLGVGRFGGIAGSFLVAELSRRGLTTPQIFMIVAMPGAVAAAAILLKRSLYGAARPEGAAQAIPH